MTSQQIKSWHVGRWPPLAWLETLIKLAGLAVGITAGWQALAAPAFYLPTGWELLGFIILIILSLGLVLAIFDRWTDREIIAMAFVVINNLGHWGMVISLATSPGPGAALLSFAGLMLLGDLVKLVFIRLHRFTVRSYSSAVLIGLTSVYIAGYGILILIEQLGK